MCQSNNRPERNVCIWEGWAKWISERETIEEKLVAYETIMAIAFPDDDSAPYQPPSRPVDGSKLSKCDLIRRDVYNQWHGIIENRGGRNALRAKDPVRIEIGRMGAAKRWGQRINDPLVGCSEVDSEQMPNCDSLEEHGEERSNARFQSVTERDSRKDTSSSSYIADEELEELGAYKKTNRYQRELTEDDKERIRYWRNKFPNAKALQVYIEKQWALPNRQIAISEAFCNYAFTILDEESNWCSSKDHRPFRGIQNALHWLVIRYKEQTSRMAAADKRIEKEQKQIEFETKLDAAEHHNQDEQSANERKQRRAAEREALKKIRKGEILGDA